MRLSFLTVLISGLLANVVAAAEHKVEPLADAPPSEVAPAIAAQLGGPAFRVVRGGSRTICDVWLCKQWTPSADTPKPTGDVIYPFQPGQLIGVIRYPKKAADFRDQSIRDGVYTLRYGQQPVDGAHVGTSPTRDFFVLLKTDDDKTVEPLEYKTLIKHSANAAGSTHPLLLSLQRVAGASTESLAIRHQEEHDWWIVRFQGDNRSAGKVEKVTVELVVVGKAAE